MNTFFARTIIQSENRRVYHKNNRTRVAQIYRARDSKTVSFLSESMLKIWKWPFGMRNANGENIRFCQNVFEFISFGKFWKRYRTNNKNWKILSQTQCMWALSFFSKFLSHQWVHLNFEITILSVLRLTKSTVES